MSSRNVTGIAISVFSVRGEARLALPNTQPEVTL